MVQRYQDHLSQYFHHFAYSYSKKEDSELYSYKRQLTARIQLYMAKRQPIIAIPSLFVYWVT